MCSIDLMEVYKWEVDEFFHNSDHAPIYLTDCEPLPKGGRQRWITSKADWTKFQENTEIEVTVEELESVESALNFLDDIILVAAERAMQDQRELVEESLHLGGTMNV